MGNKKFSSFLGVAASATTLVLILQSTSSLAYDFTLGDDIQGKIGSTIAYGTGWRVGNPDPNLMAATNGGNQNYDAWSNYTSRITGTHEVSLNWKDGGFFSRVTYFYDSRADAKSPIIYDGTGRAIVDPRWVDQESIAKLSLLDFFVYQNVGPANVRLGKQVISWGESTFIGNNLNDINSVDVAKTRVPGVELKQALLPTKSVRVQWNLTDNVSLDSFYLFSFDNIKLDPAGSFFNTGTFIADGGVLLGPLYRGGERKAKNSGQYGLALRYVAAELGEGVEFGAYYMNLHSHVPALSAVRGTPYGTARYFLDYAEDIKLLGASFNTRIGSLAVSGEWSHRNGAPVQLAGFLQAALGAPSQLTPSGPVAVGAIIKGYDRINIDQIQVTAQKSWATSQFLKYDKADLIFEAGVTHNSKMPALLTNSVLNSMAWGYQVKYSAEYDGAIANIINLIPNIAVRHDVHGTAGPFLDGAKAVTVGVDFQYQNNWTGGVSFTRNFDGPYDYTAGLAQSNLRGDRDRNFLAANIAYQF